MIKPSLYQEQKTGYCPRAHIHSNQINKKKLTTENQQGTRSWRNFKITDTAVTFTQILLQSCSICNWGWVHLKPSDSTRHFISYKLSIKNTLDNGISLKQTANINWEKLFLFKQCFLFKPRAYHSAEIVHKHVPKPGSFWILVELCENVKSIRILSWNPMIL